MGGTRNDLHETIMPQAPSPPRQTRFIESFHHLPEPGASAGLLTVPRAGHVEAGPGYGVRRAELQGHDILYCLSGRGTATVGGIAHAVAAGQLVWLPGHLPHGHEASSSEPWTLLWLRLDGLATLTAWTRLLSGRRTVLDVRAGSAMVAWFGRLFDLLRTRPIDIALPLNALVAELLVLIEGEAKGGLATRLPLPLARLTAAVAARPSLPWSEADMTAVAHVSGPHLRRLFRQHLSATPRAWVRRQRLLLAQELLSRPSARVGEVATACGFSDIYHFSREFRRQVGQAPSQWRKAEGATNGPGSMD
jgi:AraC family transcriptional regulator, arabinose operon regulatory protein